MEPLTLAFGAQSSCASTAFFRASSKGPSVSHSVPSLPADAVLPQRTFCTAPSVRRGGGANGVAAVAELVGTACGPSAAEALADTAGATALVEGLRHRYSGTAISIATQTNATTTCARNGRSPPPLEPTPKRRTRGSPGTEGNEERDGGPAMAERLLSI